MDKFSKISINISNRGLKIGNITTINDKGNIINEIIGTKNIFNIIDKIFI
jgi:hypothetical protein